MIQIRCPECCASLTFADAKAGQNVDCPKCGTRMHLPADRDAADQEIRISLDDPAPDDLELASPAKPAEPSRASSARVITGTASPSSEPDLSLTDRPDASPAKPAADAPLPTAGGLGLESIDGATVVTFQSSRILDSAVIETIGGELFELADELSCPKLALDFTGVEFLSSQMIGVLMTLHKKVAAKKGRLFLCAVHPDLQKVFKIVNLQKMLPILPDRRTALGVLSLP